ncbi:MAG: hypothetical protein ACR2JY_19245 [Chloroflexota bacterium]
MTPTVKLVSRAALLVAAKDAPIVAGAAHARAAHLATFDRQHLMSMAPEIKQEFGVEVVLPGDLLHLVQGDHSPGTA